MGGREPVSCVHLADGVESYIETAFTLSSLTPPDGPEFVSRLDEPFGLSWGVPENLNDERQKRCQRNGVAENPAGQQPNSIESNKLV